jgi:hypothetical protein
MDYILRDLGCVTKIVHLQKKKLIAICKSFLPKGNSGWYKFRRVCWVDNCIVCEEIRNNVATYSATISIEWVKFTTWAYTASPLQTIWRCRNAKCITAFNCLVAWRCRCTIRWKRDLTHEKISTHVHENFYCKNIWCVIVRYIHNI